MAAAHPLNPTNRMNRRKLLSYALGTSAVATTSLLALSLQQTKSVTPKNPLQLFTEKEYSILVAVADVLLPDNPPFPAASELDIAGKVDAVMATAGPEQQEEFRLVLFLIENPTVSTLISLQSSPFSKSDDTNKNQRIEDWRTGLPKLRTAFKALNGICNGAYYADKRVTKLTGYNGPPEEIVALRKTKGYR